ncbi:MAG: hypothetical protein LBU29_00895 [Endomicrobium sp.]|jgi:3-deoxy-D-manno-octulosonic-acid transferase|nr:hypothetical protein [Endomicrobium sp.]
MTKAYLVIYNIFFILFLPFAVFVVFFNKKYRREFFFELSERFAIYKPLNKKSKKGTIWLHCASLGEVRCVEPVLDNLKGYYIVLTSVTKSGREYAQKLQKADFVALLPLDIYPIVKKAFNQINPDMLVLVETEFWATMLYTAAHKNVKIITINGRISDKSFKIYKKSRLFWSKFVGLIDIIIARSEDDARRFRILSNGKNNVIVSGNIKYNSGYTSYAKRQHFSLNEDDFVFTAGSTREGEEEIIADAYNMVRSNFNDVKFFLVPRHLSRIVDVTEILKNKNIEYSMFSLGEFSSNFVLVDAFGKLQDIYSISDVCYVGGSIVNKGGQNPIEPAAYGKPVLFGKNMHNFKSESENLIKNCGALIVENQYDLADKIKKFIGSKQLSKHMGQNALKTVESQKGALLFTMKKLKEYLNA